MKLLVQKSTTSKLARVFIQDSSEITGVGLTGLTFESASLTAYYIKETEASATEISLITMTVGTWASGGFKEVDATNMPGVYEIGIPNACLTTNDSVVIMLKGVADMAPVLLEIQLVSFNPNDAVRMGLTALANAAAGAAGGLPTDSTGKTSFNDVSAADIVTTALTESYGAAAAERTLTQLLYEIKSLLTNFDTAGTTLSTKKLDGSTEAKTYKFDDATNPTALEETT